MIDHKKYKWFFTSNNLLVVGGKSAEQNDALLSELRKIGKNFIVMHTSNPGSPFCAIISDVDKVKKKDLEECAIFTGCFSQAWKQGLKETSVDIFSLDRVSKPKLAKTGTWQVAGKIETRKVKLELALVKQKGVWRAVPRSLAGKEDIVASPGKIDKAKMIDEILERVGEPSSKKDEVLAALPAGGLKIH